MTAPALPPSPLRAMPEPQVGVFMFPSEAFRGNWRAHWMRPTWRMVAAAIAGSVMYLGQTDRLGKIGLDYTWHPIERDVSDITALGAVIIAWVLWALWCLIAWRRRVMALTDCRLMMITGVLSRRVSSLPVTALDHTGLRQTVFGRIFGYGSLVSSAVAWYQPMARIRHVATPRYTFVRMVEESCEPEAASARRAPVPAQARPYEPTEQLAIGRSPSYTDVVSDEYPDTGGMPDFDMDRPIYGVPRHRAKPTNGSPGSLNED